ncbi:MAG: type II toxin-antitoxin system death-on-curing family toxin [Saprospiraceae bacterium]
MRFFYLTRKDILQIHDDAIVDSGGGSGLRNEAGIESAIAAPQTVYFGQEQYPTIADKAAVLCFELVTQHPFIDGNKRVGHSAMANFLYMNGYTIDETDDEQESIILRVAAGEMTKEAFTEWVTAKIIPVDLHNL